jgi:hypothetical protein
MSDCRSRDGSIGGEVVAAWHQKEQPDGAWIGGSFRPVAAAIERPWRPPDALLCWA